MRRHRTSIATPVAACLLLIACSQGASTSLDVTGGSTEVLTFDVPREAAALSILARSDNPETLIQLATLSFANTLPLPVHAEDRDRMSVRFEEHEVIETPSGFVHEVQRGTYAFTYPFAPAWDLPPGPASMSFLVDGASKVEVEIVFVEVTDRPLLEITVFSPGSSRLSADARRGVEAIFDEAGITVSWREGDLGEHVPASFADIDDRRTGSDIRTLLAAVAMNASGGANLVIADDLPGGISGFATGVPGPHDGTGAAVAVTLRSPSETARLVAHEVAHLLGLRHLEDRSAQGVVVTNPITDTRADAYNLMQFGTHLTEGQIEVIRLSPLLSKASGG